MSSAKRRAVLVPDASMRGAVVNDNLVWYATKYETRGVIVY